MPMPAYSVHEDFSLFTLRCALLDWFTQFTLTASIPSRDCVHGAKTIILNFAGESCLCYIFFDNNVSSIIVSNVHSVVGDVRVHMDDI